MATNLGTVKVYVKKGTKLFGVAFSDNNNTPVAGSRMNAIRPTTGDRVIVEFEELPE